MLKPFPQLLRLLDPTYPQQGYRPPPNKALELTGRHTEACQAPQPPAARSGSRFAGRPPVGSGSFTGGRQLNAVSVGQRGETLVMRVLKYIEKCTGTNHNGPAWIAYVQTSRSGRTIYFNGRALQASTRGGGVGSHYDLETREAYWVSGVKKSGSNRHWAGSGHILVEESAVNELLSLTGEKSLDKSLYRITPDLSFTDPQQFADRFNEEL